MLDVSTMLHDMLVDTELFVTYVMPTIAGLFALMLVLVLLIGFIQEYLTKRK